MRVRQNTETPLTTLIAPFGTALYLYARSADSVSAGVIGQDYVTFRYDETNVAFAVCDGVGQSFMGDLAARLLGEGLVNWLWALDERPESAEAFSAAVGQSLDALAQQTAPEVAAYKLPPTLPGLVVQALEMQRAYGSESMFVAGRLALAPEQGWLALCWLGDSPVAAIDIDGKLVDLGPRGHTSERWNATTGIKGEVHAWVGDSAAVARVAGYTDGLARDHIPTDADLADLMGGWVSDPPEDDASLFDVRLAPSPETTGQVKAPSPEEFVIPPVPAPEPRPIEVEEAPRTPVSGVQPIEAEGETSPAVEGWRPLTEAVPKPQKSQPPAEPPQAAPQPGQPPAPGTLPDPAQLLTQLSGQAMASMQPGAAPPPAGATQQQIAMWQQAALMGLINAALAMLMVDRLLKQPPDGGPQGSEPQSGKQG